VNGLHFAKYGNPINFARQFQNTMTEVKQRAANIIRFVSMISVVAALLFMYGYGTDEHVIRNDAEGLLSKFPRSTIFYTGLVIFAVFNLLMNWGIKAYREAEGFDVSSILFRTERQKAGILLWLTLLLGALNFFLGFLISYIGFIKIEGLSAQNSYLPLPVIGLVITVVVFAGLIISVFSNRQ